MSNKPRTINDSRLGQALFSRFTNRLVAAAGGRAHILNQAAYAEDADEGDVFEALLERVDDPELHKMVRIHQTDEKRHAELFREALRRNGFEPYPVPRELSLLERLDAALGGFFESFTEREHPVMDAYILLQVIEERAVTQFSQLRTAFAKYDPQTAELLDEISRDEARHLKYCVAISRRYAPDEETRLQTLAEFRRHEAQVFAELSRANMRHVLEAELPDMSRLELRIWRGILSLLSRANRPVPTPYWDAEPAAA